MNRGSNSSVWTSSPPSSSEETSNHARMTIRTEERSAHSKTGYSFVEEQIRRIDLSSTVNETESLTRSRKKERRMDDASNVG